MQQTKSKAKPATLELPPTAPLVRITAGAGTPAQKTWNLRRPLTLIGSRRPSSILLHGRDVSKAHCVIVNTGNDLLLKDLHTRGSTLLNREPVGLADLSDGDIITVGDTTLQIAVQLPQNLGDDSGCDLEFNDPRRMGSPGSLKLEHTENHWDLREAVVLVGRHESAEVRLDHEQVSERHAVLFLYGNRLAVCDLGSRSGVQVNGEACSMSVLKNGDRLGIGPLTLIVEWASSESRTPVDPMQHPDIIAAPPLPVQNAPSSPKVVSNSAGEDRLEDPCRDLIDIAEKLSEIQQNIGTSWDRLNSWERHEDHQVAADTRRNDLDARESALDARDAVIRGHMHDITRYHDELAARERELAAQVALIQSMRDEQTSAEHAQSLRQAEVDKRGEELKRREHVLAQRWARLNGMNCPHCGEPITPSAEP